MPDEPAAEKALTQRVLRLEEIFARIDDQDREGRLRASAFLHDQPLQSLASAVVRMGLVRSRGDDPVRAQADLGRAEELVREGLEKVRLLSHELRRGSASDDDLPTAMEALADRARTTLELEVTFEQGTERRPADLEITGVLIGLLRRLMLEVRARGGRECRLGYAEGGEGALVVELRASELDTDAAVPALEMGRWLDPAAHRLRAFDAETTHAGESVRVVIPEPLVEEPAVRPDPARSRSG